MSQAAIAGHESPKVSYSMSNLWMVGTLHCTLHWKQPKSTWPSHTSTIHYHPFTIHYHLLPSITIHYHPLPSITIHYHPLPSITIHYHPLPSITIHYHPLPSITILYNYLATAQWCGVRDTCWPLVLRTRFSPVPWHVVTCSSCQATAARTAPKKNCFDMFRSIWVLKCSKYYTNDDI